MKAPPLKDDCFAMPPGVTWTPVDAALDHLATNLHCVTGCETVSVASAGGRILSSDVKALRANPPYANSAVDGYGFAFASLPDQQIIEVPLVDGRSAAGQPYAGAVPHGSAVRILTGARLPDGVDTVVLEEDCTVEAGKIAFRAGLKMGANTRKQGEDVAEGQALFSQGYELRAQDLALLAACGLQDVPVHNRLRVGVLSTGDEVVTSNASDTQIYDANRPMLLDQLRRWGYEAVDLGHVADDPAALRQTFDNAASQTDAILTTGGASAGDEDHVSALLKSEGALQTWRIAVKPGRPLALAMWNGVPVFGLPGNPVAAYVCTLIFARPALRYLAGGTWSQAQGMLLPAGFEKTKKAGRREYLRARIGKDGQVETFKSEGSGRISGLSWSDGLVELPDEALTIQKGDLVRYIPYTAF